jgi:hypothetical protein
MIRTKCPKAHRNYDRIYRKPLSGGRYNLKHFVTHGANGIPQNEVNDFIAAIFWVRDAAPDRFAGRE